MTCLDLGGRHRAATTAPTRATEHHNQNVHNSVDTLAGQAYDVGTATHSEAESI